MNWSAGQVVRKLFCWWILFAMTGLYQSLYLNKRVYSSRGVYHSAVGSNLIGIGIGMVDFRMSGNILWNQRLYAGLYY